MYEIDNLAKELPAPEEPQKDYFDEMQRLDDLLFKRAFDEAAELSDELLTKRYYHITPIGAVLFVAYRDTGPKLIPRLVKAVEGCLGINFDKLQPQDNRARHVNRGLTSVFDRMTRFSADYEQSNHERYQQWRQALGPDDLQAAISILSAQRDALPEAMSDLRNEMGAYLEWLRRQPPIEPEEEPADEGGEQASDTAAPAEAPSGNPNTNATSSSAKPKTMELTVSPRLALLLDKLAAFEALVDKAHYDKAAVVSVDLRKELESFDPRLYFPELFARYSELMSAHVNDIAPHFDNQGSLTFQLLHEFYTVNLQGFVEG